MFVVSILLLGVIYGIFTISDQLGDIHSELVKLNAAKRGVEKENPPAK